jgi:hypothetical protein
MIAYASASVDKADSCGVSVSHRRSAALLDGWVLRRETPETVQQLGREFKPIRER